MDIYFPIHFLRRSKFMRPSCVSELDVTNAIKVRYGAYLEKDIKSVILVDDDDEDEFIIRIVTEEYTKYGPETTTIEEYITGPESQTTAFKDCHLLADCADILLDTIPLLQNHFEIIHIPDEKLS